VVFGQAREKSTAVKREAGSFSSTGLFVSSADFFSLQLDETADNSSLKLATTAGRFSCAGTSHSKCWRQVGLERDGRLCDVARPGTCGRLAGPLEAISGQCPGDEV